MLAVYVVPPGVAAAVGYLAASYSNTITLGSLILGTLIGVAGLGVFGYGVRWKSAYEAEHAAATSLEDGRRAYFQRAERLEDELKETRAQLLDCSTLVGDQKKTIARLEQLPNLERVLHLIGEISVKQDAAAERRLEHGLQGVRDAFAEQTRRVIDEVHANRAAIEKIDDRIDG